MCHCVQGTKFVIESNDTFCLRTGEFSLIYLLLFLHLFARHYWRELFSAQYASPKYAQQQRKVQSEATTTTTYMLVTQCHVLLFYFLPVSVFAGSSLLLGYYMVHDNYCIQNFANILASSVAIETSLIRSNVHHEECSRFSNVCELQWLLWNVW